ncbi:arrestin domain-containing protein 2-like [Ruditapes philippinarum]|uniref:arrestin domain-containing protein 2-like n=1 Tax=Ruditapes philippinarum TaxID=129788 RepID=UPI00295C1875|nr:arrestin domain-containing protein 2-like [Ruditapes philippinarum]
MAVTAIDLNLESDELVFYSGQRIKGALVVQISLPIIIAGIEVRFRGAARAKWNETVQNGPHRTDIEHEKEEIYFDDRFCLWGRVNSQNRWDTRETLQRGRHAFPFQYRVPGAIPCSFEGPDAHVRYTVQGIIVRYDGEHITCRKVLTVLRDFDPRKENPDKLAIPPELPLEDHAERAISSVCCRPGRVSCSLAIMKRAFVPGEILRADIHVQNSSIRKSSIVSLQLKQMLIYGGVHSRTLLLCNEKVCESLRPGQHRLWSNFPLRLPSTCPSKLYMCKVLDVKYCIAIEATFPDTVLYAAVPVTIATVPETSCCPFKWIYKLSERPIISEDENVDSFIHGCSKNIDMEFRPMYKYYEDLKDYRKDRETVLRLRQSPGVKRRREKAKCLPAAKATVVKLLPDESVHYNSFA